MRCCRATNSALPMRLESLYTKFKPCTFPIHLSNYPMSRAACFMAERPIVIAALWVALCLIILPLTAYSQIGPEILLSKARNELNSGPDAAKSTLEQLGKIESTLSPDQRIQYFRLLLASYAFRGMYKEQVTTSERVLPDIADSDQRAFVLYYLADGYASLGEYEKALRAMNDSILLLPKLVDLKAKMGVLQSAVSLLESLHAYDEASTYAQRLIELSSDRTGLPACMGAGDQVEIAFVRHDGDKARALLPEAIKLCDGAGHKIITLSIQALDAVDQLNSGGDAKILQESIALLANLSKFNERSDYTIQLADAIAKRYLAFGQPAKAEIYATRATQWATAGNAILLRQQTNETMAAIMRAQGKLEQALNYRDISQSLWANLLEERSRKDLAYQRVKFQTQDQSNQLSLLSQINRLLTSERELQERNKHSLELLVLVTGLLLAGVVIWLIRTWRQKNDYRTFSQVDGLTKVSNRTHLITCATEAFKDARCSIAVILFDMDEFKQINDTFNHATGDWVLKAVSNTISHCLRSQDLFGRLGGEEFAICLPNTPEHEAQVLAERCRSAIAAIDSTPSGYNFSITASFGISVRPPNGPASFEETLAAADQALYRAKHLGRNRIAVHGELPVNTASTT